VQLGVPHDVPPVRQSIGDLCRWGRLHTQLCGTGAARTRVLLTTNQTRHERGTGSILTCGEPRCTRWQRPTCAGLSPSAAVCQRHCACGARCAAYSPRFLFLDANMRRWREATQQAQLIVCVLIGPRKKKSPCVQAVSGTRIVNTTLWPGASTPLDGLRTTPPGTLVDADQGSLL